MMKPDFCDLYISRGNTLRKIRRLDEALSNFDMVVSLMPNSADAFYNRSNVLMDMNRYEEAAAGYAKAIALNSRFANVYNNLGQAYNLQGRLDDALLCFQQALTLDPADAAHHISLLLSLNYRSDLHAASIYAEHVRWGELHGNVDSESNTHLNTAEGDKILRIGYISADFNNHPVGFFIENVLALHHRYGFQVFCYSNSATADEHTVCLRSYAGYWRNIVDLTDAQ